MSYCSPEKKKTKHTAVDSSTEHHALTPKPALTQQKFPSSATSYTLDCNLVWPNSGTDTGVFSPCKAGELPCAYTAETELNRWQLI